ILTCSLSGVRMVTVSPSATLTTLPDKVAARAGAVASSKRQSVMLKTRWAKYHRTIRPSLAQRVLGGVNFCQPAKSYPPEQRSYVNSLTEKVKKHSQLLPLRGKSDRTSAINYGASVNSQTHEPGGQLTGGTHPLPPSHKPR